MSELPGDCARVVVDTNIVLDLLVFDDPASTELAEALARGPNEWIACEAMRDELERVLGYPAIDRHLRIKGRNSGEVLAAYDQRIRRLLPEPPRAACRCSDPDDQVFIDLAVAQGACLLSKDRAVLAMRKRLDALGVKVLRSWPAAMGRGKTGAA